MITSCKTLGLLKTKSFSKWKQTCRVELLISELIVKTVILFVKIKHQSPLPATSYHYIKGSIAPNTLGKEKGLKTAGRDHFNNHPNTQKANYCERRPGWDVFLLLLVPSRPHSCCQRNSPTTQSSKSLKQEVKFRQMPSQRQLQRKSHEWSHF